MATTVYSVSSQKHRGAKEALHKPAARPFGFPDGGGDFISAGETETRKIRRVPVMDTSDIIPARQYGRELAARYGSSETQATLIATVISELSRNMVLYAKGGTISLSMANGGQGIGVVISAEDNGPGIPNVERVMMGGYSTSGGLGQGLCGVQRIADEFLIDTKVGNGTKITVKKWL